MDNHEMIYKATYFFGEKPLIVKTWDLDLLLDKKYAQKLPIWVQLHGLDAKYSSASSLSKLTSVLCKPVKVDKATQDKDKIIYAHILSMLIFLLRSRLRTLYPSLQSSQMKKKLSCNKQLHSL